MITVIVSFQAVFLSGQVTFFSSCHEFTKYPLNGERKTFRRKNFQTRVFLTGAVTLAAAEAALPVITFIRFPITLLPIKKEPIWLIDASVSQMKRKMQALSCHLEPVERPVFLK